ncbi:triacylglycerol lipase [Komagataeibacter sp. FNDCF1]|uniref:esterase/lipase family protein n=1 Tax=Komagataeibacter sp. FNDCF1 TaxID=2878681 RepID=UPI001E4959D3|nr:alpha/beta hydrolase [Komagataeibacter sp. FNDCF1]MCE2563631.1 alpha/beta hydrolase [Komagataeibacter sp. FNDCF1]
MKWTETGTRLVITARMGRAARIATLVAMAGLAGCAGPVTVRQVSLVHSYRVSTRTALQGGAPSDNTLIVLRRHALLGQWRRQPDQAIATLRMQATGHDDTADVLFALAELSYRQGLRHHHRQDFLAAALYAYAYLQPGQGGTPGMYDPRFRQACDLYNLGLTATFGAPVTIADQTLALPFGTIDVVADRAQLRWHDRVLDNIRPTATMGVEGINNIYRTPGLGEALTAQASPALPATTPTPARDDPEATPDGSFSVAPKLRLPASLLLELDNPRMQVLGTQLHGRLVLRVMDQDTSTTPIGTAQVPTAYDQTTARALSLVDTALGTKEYRGFFDGTTFDGTHPRLVAMNPHRRGSMPVIFVHGTASSPYRWANMVNDLLEEPAIRDHFDFWFFSYATSNPIPYSAWQLRHAITQAVARLGGVSADPALGHITLVGHSQGGLLARMLVIDPGERLWEGTAGRPLSSFHLNADTRALVEKTMFPTAMPEIQRVVFISTPQHGSYLAGLSVARLIGSMASLPFSVTETARELVTSPAGDSTHLRNRIPRLGSVYAMSPRSAFMRTLPTIPIVPDVHTHSIIPVCGDPHDLAHANDGVVSYESAHIPGVESELVVRNSEHSTQSNPVTIAEVERILLEQLAANPAPSTTSIRPTGR